MRWWQKRPFWVAICVAIGLSVAKFGHHPFFTVLGALFVALGITVALIRNRKGDEYD